MSKGKKQIFLFDHFYFGSQIVPSQQLAGLRLFETRIESPRGTNLCFLETWAVSLPIEFLTPACHILSDTHPWGQKGNLKGLWGSKALAIMMLLWQSFLPLVYKVAVNTSFAFPAYRASGLHVAPREGNFSLLCWNLRLTDPWNHTEGACVSFVWVIFPPSTFPFRKVPWLVDLEKAGFELHTAGTEVGLLDALFSGMLTCW